MSASGASTNRRAAAAGWGTSSSLAAFAGSRSASTDWAVGRPLDRDPRPTEDEQVEVELARAPAPSLPAPEGALERLELGQERQRPGRRVGSGRRVDRDDGVAELGLVGDADRRGRVQARHVAEAVPGRPASGRRPPRSASPRHHRRSRRDRCTRGPDGSVTVPSMAAARLRAMRPVTVRIMHPEPGPEAGPLEGWVADARAPACPIATPTRFAAAGASDVGIVGRTARRAAVRRAASGRSSPPTGRPGSSLLGSGAIPLATRRDRRDLVDAAAADDRVALANNRYSADAIAIAAPRMCSPTCRTCRPTTRSRAGSPRSPATRSTTSDAAGGSASTSTARSTSSSSAARPGRAAGDGATAVDTARVRERLAAVRAVARDPNAELLVAGRTSAATLAWLERSTAARTRALVEERGLRTQRRRPAAAGLRPRRLLERDGPGSLGSHLAQLSDAAIVDSRVLLAHRLGADEPPLARRRGPLRLGPAARRADRRSVAARS